MLPDKVLSDKIIKSVRKTALGFGLIASLSLSACTFQPLYGPTSTLADTQNFQLRQVGVSEVSTRVGQQVRNHLIYLFSGGNEDPAPRYEARLQVTSFERRTSAQASLRDTTAGFVTVTTSYTLIDTGTKKRVAGGSRTASASFDRTSQTFANQRAVRDAENRAGKAVAEQLRLAIASDLHK